MMPGKQPTSDICKSHSYNGFEEQKIGPSLSCENSRPSSTNANYTTDDANNNHINNQTHNGHQRSGNQQSSNLHDNPMASQDKLNGNQLGNLDDRCSNKNGSNEKCSNGKCSNGKCSNGKCENCPTYNCSGNNCSSKNDQNPVGQSNDERTTDQMNRETMNKETRISNEELSTDDNLASNPNESSTNDEDADGRNINVPNYLLLADEQNKTDSTMYFVPKHGLQHTALGLKIPKLINTFPDENLEFAYQLYSMRQRHSPLIVINFINFLLTLVFISLPIFLVFKERQELIDRSVLTFELIKLLTIGISLNLHLVLPSVLVLLIALAPTCANHHLHYVGYCTLAITLFLTQLIEKGQLHVNPVDGQIDFLLFDRFDGKPMHTIDSHSIGLPHLDASLNSSLTSANLIRNTTNLFLSQNTWFLLYTVFITYVILPLSLKWSTICSLGCLLLDLLLAILTTQHEHPNCTLNFNLIVSGFLFLLFVCGLCVVFVCRI